MSDRDSTNINIPNLNCTAGEYKGQVIHLYDKLRLGRHRANDLYFRGPTVSGFHAEISKVENHYEIIDLNSKNRTKVNGRRIFKATILRHNDLIEIGRNAFVFQYKAAEATSPIRKNRTGVKTHEVAQKTQRYTPKPTSTIDNKYHTEARAAEDVSSKHKVRHSPESDKALSKPRKILINIMSACLVLFMIILVIIKLFPINGTTSGQEERVVSSRTKYMKDIWRKWNELKPQPPNMREAADLLDHAQEVFAQTHSAGQVMVTPESLWLTYKECLNALSYTDDSLDHSKLRVQCQHLRKALQVTIELKEEQHYGLYYGNRKRANWDKALNAVQYNIQLLDLEKDNTESELANLYHRFEFEIEKKTTITSYTTSQAEPSRLNQSENSAKTLYEKALPFVANSEFNKAWPLLEQAVGNSEDDLVYPKALIVLQQLSYIQYRLISLDAAEGYNKEKVNNIYNEAKRIDSKILSYITINEKELYILDEAKNRLKDQVSGLKNRCVAQKNYLVEIESADKAFERKEYELELFHLNKAEELGGPVREQLAQCRLFCRAIDLLKREQYEQADKHFRKIKTNDRHYSVAESWLKQIRARIFERDYRHRLNNAWRKLDWILLEEQIRLIENNKLYNSHLERSCELAKLLSKTKNILDVRRLYYQSSKKNDLCAAAEHLKRIRDYLEVDSKQSYFFSARKWHKTEWEQCVLNARVEIERMNQGGNAVWKIYMKDPITNRDIDDLAAFSDYTSIISKADLLRTLHVKLSKAYELSKAIELENNIRNELDSVEIEIFGRCKQLFNRAYILEVNYGDIETAEKLYEVVIIMPSFVNNSYPNTAGQRLIALQKRVNH